MKTLIFIERLHDSKHERMYLGTEAILALAVLAAQTDTPAPDLIEQLKNGTPITTATATWFLSIQELP